MEIHMQEDSKIIVASNNGNCELILLIYLFDGVPVEC